MNDTPRKPQNILRETEYLHFFISHLNRIYCAKSELVDKLPQLAGRSHYVDLQQAIAETVETVNLQVGRIKKIFIALDTFYQPESCVGLSGVLDEAFQSIGAPGESPGLRDLSILFYMQNIESIETASFRVMTEVAHRLERPDVEQCLLECYDEAREEKVLYREITANYL